ncbi:hypothetical protein BU15DRAFT_84038 [Melanogaster broomeanus]|nr:hypothetical protein BU15DRAFT_84038 [Melanogaster broomeanus]
MSGQPQPPSRRDRRLIANSPPSSPAIALRSAAIAKNPEPAQFSVSSGRTSSSRTTWVNWEPSRDDFPFILVVAAALGDARETKWYGVWDVVLKDYLFRNCHTATVACTTMPQYSLVADYDTFDEETYDEVVAADREEVYDEGDIDQEMEVDASPDLLDLIQPGMQGLRAASFHSTLDSPLGQRGSASSLRANVAPSPSYRRRDRTGPMEASDSPGQIMPYGLMPGGGCTWSTPPSTPPPHPGSKRRSRRVPDFAQVLQCVTKPFPHYPTALKAERVILLVENKPTTTRPLRAVYETTSIQIEAQARHAFYADPELKAIGAIVAIGKHFRYMVLRRAQFPPRSLSEEIDMDYVPEVTVTPPWVDAGPLDHLGRDFELLDAKGLFMAAFREILKHLIFLNSDIWNPQV